jgi:hypothetical protein
MTGLQVEPERFKHQNMAILSYQEALEIERLRGEGQPLSGTANPKA